MIYTRCRDRVYSSSSNATAAAAAATAEQQHILRFLVLLDVRPFVYDLSSVMSIGRHEAKTVREPCQVGTDGPLQPIPVSTREDNERGGRRHPVPAWRAMLNRRGQL